MTDTAVGLGKCSRSRISGQLSDRRQGDTVAGPDRMQAAIRVNPAAAASDENLPANNFREYRARIGTSSPCKNPVAVKIPAASLRHFPWRFIVRLFSFVFRIGKEGQFDIPGQRIACPCFNRENQRDHTQPAAQRRNPKPNSNVILQGLYLRQYRLNARYHYRARRGSQAGPGRFMSGQGRRSTRTTVDRNSCLAFNGCHRLTETYHQHDRR
jgi:hypothetical protein